jgi:hypothetical protein
MYHTQVRCEMHSEFPSINLKERDHSWRHIRGRSHNIKVDFKGDEVVNWTQVVYDRHKL